MLTKNDLEIGQRIDVDTNEGKFRATVTGILKTKNVIEIEYDPVEGEEKGAPDTLNLDEFGESITKVRGRRPGSTNSPKEGDAEQNYSELQTMANQIAMLTNAVNSLMATVYGAIQEQPVHAAPRAAAPAPRRAAPRAAPRAAAPVHAAPVAPNFGGGYEAPIMMAGHNFGGVPAPIPPMPRPVLRRPMA